MYDWINNLTGLNIDLQRHVVNTIVLLVVLWVAKRIILTIVKQQVENPTVIYNWRRALDYVRTVLIVFGLYQIWLSESENGFASLVTYFGLLSAGLAIALQTPITNFIGWAYLIARRPFDVGDRIQVGDDAGDVVDIQWFHFSLLEIRNWVDADQSTGRVLHIPNRSVFDMAVANFNRGFPFIWVEVPVTVTFESNWQKAKQLLNDAVNRHTLAYTEDAKRRISESSERYPIKYKNVTPTVYTKVVGNGITLTMRFMCEPRKRRNAEQAIWEDLLTTFSACDDIDFAYETQRIFYHPAEGKTLDPEQDLTQLPHLNT